MGILDVMKEYECSEQAARKVKEMFDILCTLEGFYKSGKIIVNPDYDFSDENECACCDETDESDVIDVMNDLEKYI